MFRQALLYLSPAATLLLAAVLAATQFQPPHSGARAAAVPAAGPVAAAAFAAPPTAPVVSSRVEEVAGARASAVPAPPDRAAFAPLTEPALPKLAIIALSATPPPRAPAAEAEPVLFMAADPLPGLGVLPVSLRPRLQTPEPEPAAPAVTPPMARRGNTQVVELVRPELPELTDERHLARFGTPVATRKILRVRQ